MKTHLVVPLAGNDQARPMRITTKIRRSLLAVTLALLAGGCYSYQCEKLGFAEGTPEHGECVRQVRIETLQSLQQTQQKQKHTVRSDKAGCFFSGGHWVSGSPGYWDPGTEI